MKVHHISVIGIGYVGLCTAVGFASKGYKVVAADKDTKKVVSINKCLPSFYEPDLEDSLQNAIKDGYLRCLLDCEQAITNTDITFIAVGTPSGPNGSIDLKQIKSSAIKIGESLAKKDSYHLVVVKSTVVPGTTINIVKPLLEKYSDKNCGPEFGLCMNPEFLREGSAIYDTLHPDRIIIGEYDKKSGSILEALFRNFYSENIPSILRTNLATAELIKYTNNAFLATKISFINTIANICEKVSGTDVNIVAEAIGLDHRINSKFLRAGLGYGGSCFPKDLKALITYSKQNSYTPTLLQSVQKVNENQPKHTINLVKNELGTLTNKKIAILGLSFKPDTDDMREARSIPLIRQLLNNNAKITAYDPAAISKAKKIFKNKIQYASSVVACLKDADCCIIVTEWNEIKQLKPETFKQNMKNPLIIDGRRTLNPQEATKHGITYYGIGYGKPKGQQ
jgi:UDPglucose 6-dehydrogenase